MRCRRQEHTRSGLFGEKLAIELAFKLVQLLVLDDSSPSNLFLESAGWLL